MSPTDTAVKSIGELQKIAIDAPTIFFALLSILVPLALLTALALVLKFWLLPAWRDEKKADREQKAADNEEFRKLIKSQQDQIVERIETEVRRHSGEIEKIHVKLDKQGEALGRIVQKLAIPTALLLIYLGGIASGFGLFVAIHKRSTQIETAANCPDGCGSLDCCGENKCCERKKDTAAKSPHSATAAADFRYFAGPTFCPRAFRSDCN